MAKKEETNPKVEKAIAISDEVMEIVITDEASMKSAVTQLSIVNKQNDAITKEKEKVTKPLNAALKAERGRWKPAEDRLKKAIAYLRREIGQAQTRLEAEAEAKKDKIVSRIGEGRGKLKAGTAVNQLANVAGPEAKVESEVGSVSFKDEIEITIVDINQIPAEFLEAREGAIKKALKEGREVSGVTHKVVKVPINRRA